MDIVKVNWSGGKDSTCSALLHIKRGDKVKIVSYIPMFTDEIPLILKDHYNFIMNTKCEFEKMGADVCIVSGMTYWDYVTRMTTRGKYKGKIFGFPSYITGQCNFKGYSKIKSLKNCDVGYYDYEGIGIAYDEINRHRQLNEHKRSILVELKVTEKQAREVCIDNDMLSPHYLSGFTRDGCILCPHKSAKEREQWYKDYPQAKEKLIELQNIVKEQRPDRPPLRNHKYFIEEVSNE